MGTAALTVRQPWPRRRGAATAGAGTLAFQAAGGPLVALCGLVGGAGTSTLAYLLASEAARSSSAAVLLGELHDRGALAALVGVGADRGLARLAAAVDNDEPITDPFSEPAPGLRLVAAARPSLDAAQPPNQPALTRVLEDARQAHGLSVVDAGAATDPTNAALLGAATHVLFVLSATLPALEHAELLADAGVFARARGRVSVVAVATRPGRGASPKQLRRFAERHADRLLLVPYLAGLAAGQLDQPQHQLQATYAALASLLRTAP